MFEYNWMFGSLLADLLALSISAIVLGMYLGKLISDKALVYRAKRLVVRNADKAILKYYNKAATDLFISEQDNIWFWMYGTSDITLADNSSRTFPKVLVIENASEKMHLKIHKDQVETLHNLFKNIHHITL